MIEKIGVQLYTIRDYMQTAEDIRASFRKLKAMGITQGQTAGCAIDYAEYGKIAAEEGFELVGTHDNFDMMRDDFEKSYENHVALGLVEMNMGTGGYFRMSVEEIEQFIKDANVVAKKIAEKGGKFTYHNHHNEFLKLENGSNMMEMLVEKLDPENATYVLDTHWVQRGGGDPIWWINRLAGKIDILHLKDMTVVKNEAGETIPYITEVGNGHLNWDGILEAAEKAGVKYYVIEQDTNWIDGDPFKSLEVSANFLKKYMK